MPPSAESRILPARQIRINFILWVILTLNILMNFTLIRVAGLHIHFINAESFGIALIACIGIALFYHYIYRDDTMYLFGNSLGQIICMGFAISTSVNLCATLNLPLIDTSLIAIDSFFRFDWRHYVAFVDTKPLLISIFNFTYQLITIQIIIIICTLFFFKESAHAQRFILGFYCTGLLTAILSGLLPAVGTYIYYDIDIHHYVNMRPTAARVHEALLLSLRNHSITSLDIPGKGIVTFPSFHAALGVLLIYGSLPLKRFRLLIIPFNITMLFSTPIDGGHWLTDVVGGIFLTVITLYITERILPRRPLPQ